MAADIQVGTKVVKAGQRVALDYDGKGWRAGEVVERIDHLLVIRQEQCYNKGPGDKGFRRFDISKIKTIVIRS